MLSLLKALACHIGPPRGQGSGLRTLAWEEVEGSALLGPHCRGARALTLRGIQGCTRVKGRDSTSPLLMALAQSRQLEGGTWVLWVCNGWGPSVESYTCQWTHSSVSPVSAHEPKSSTWC